MKTLKNVCIALFVVLVRSEIQYLVKKSCNVIYFRPF